MNPKDQKPETNPGSKWERDLESVRSTLSTMESVEPPDLLDQAVLNTARRELAASRRKPMRWVGAFATAAVVVLALTIVIQQDQKIPKPYRGNGIKLDVARPAAEKESAIGVSAMSESAIESLQSPAALSDEVSPDTAKQAGLLREEQARDALLRIDSTAPQKAEEVGEEALPDPLAWIEKMLELQQAKRYEELKTELEAFRKAYPDYALPPQLQD